MKNHALLSYLYACLLGIFVFPTMGQAQTAPTSPWTISADMGFSLIISCPACDPGNFIDIPLTSNHTMSYQTVGLQASKRTARWLGWTGHLGMGGLRVQSTNILFDADGEQGYPAQRNIAVNTWLLTIGPQFFIRIGQGDLGLEIRTGIAMQTARVKATGFQGQEFDIKYKPVFNGAVGWRLGYTFWPRDRFGISTGLEYSGSYFRTNSIGRPNTFEARTPLESTYPDENPETLNRLSPRNNGVLSLNFLLGVTYRLNR